MPREKRHQLISLKILQKPVIDLYIIVGKGMVSMKDEDFEKTMDSWAAHEVESAPQLRPTEEIYRMIKKRKSSFPV